MGRLFRLFSRYRVKLKKFPSRSNRFQSKFQNIKPIFNLIKPHGKVLAIASSGLFVSTAVAMSLPVIIGKVIDLSNQKESSKRSKTLLLSSAAVIFAVGAGASFVRSFYFNNLSNVVTKKLRGKLFSHLIRRDINFFDRSKVGELITRLSSDIEVMGRSFAGDNLSLGLRNSLQLFGSLSIMAYLSTKLTIAIAIVVPMSYYSSKYFSLYIKKISHKIQNELSISNSIAEESFNNIMTVKSFNKESYEISKYDNSIGKIFMHSSEFSKVNAFFFSSAAMFGNFSALAILSYGSVLISQGELSIGILTSFLFYTVYLGYSGINLATFFGQFMRGMGASTKVFGYLNSPIDQSELYEKNITNLPKKFSTIEFNKVSFHYPSREETLIFKDFSIKILPKKITGIFGSSGVGKTTLFNLVLQFYRPTTGKVLFDGVDANSIPPSLLRSRIGIVSQSIELFSSTIFENIAYGLKDKEIIKDKEDLRNRVVIAAKAANAHDFIMAFPDGYETKVGGSNVGLSGGERQRVAFARVLLFDPDIFLLDEVTSALDKKNKKLIFDTVEKLKDKTILMVTHSLEIAKRCDRVILVKEGKVVKYGTPEEVIGRKEFRV